MEGTRRASAGDVELRLLGPVEALRQGQSVSSGARNLNRPGDARARARSRRVHRSPDRERLACEHARDRRSRDPGLRLAASRGLGPGDRDARERLRARARRRGRRRARPRRRADDGHAGARRRRRALAEERLGEALALWRGPALGDLTYEPFAQGPIARLEELRLLALEARLEAQPALGGTSTRTELEALIEAAPPRERRAAQPDGRLYRAGRQADALAVFRSTRNKLVDELGIVPGPELRQPELAILGRTLPSAPPVRTPTPTTFRRLTPSSSSRSTRSRSPPPSIPKRPRRSRSASSLQSTNTVARHGGHREESAADTVIAAFGVPLSHEDDALRAARAALKLVQNEGATVRIGIGIEQARSSPDRRCTGEPLAIAAELARDAEPGEIVVGESRGGCSRTRRRSKPAAISGATPGRSIRHRTRTAAAAGRSGSVGRDRASSPHFAAHSTSSLRLRPSNGRRSRAGGRGKSRFAAELVEERARERPSSRPVPCVRRRPYVLATLREALEGAPPGKSDVALLAALASTSAAGLDELAFDVRRYCENLARKRWLPSCLTTCNGPRRIFLELLHGLASRSEGSILIVCLARDELLENESFLREAERIVLDGLWAKVTRALLEKVSAARRWTMTHRSGSSRRREGVAVLRRAARRARAGAWTGARVASDDPGTAFHRLDRLGPGQRAVLDAEPWSARSSRSTMSRRCSCRMPRTLLNAPRHLGRTRLRPGQHRAASTASVTSWCKRSSTGRRRSGSAPSSTSDSQRGSSARSQLRPSWTSSPVPPRAGISIPRRAVSPRRARAARLPSAQALDSALQVCAP